MDDEPEYDITISIDCRSPIDDLEGRQARPSERPSCFDDPASKIEGTISRTLVAALSSHGAPAAKLHVAIVDEDQIARLHRTFLDRSGPTDVLAFDLRDGVNKPAGPLEGPGLESCGPPRAERQSEDKLGKPIEGDIVVSLAAAMQESGRRGHDVTAELALYALHGLLHLLGYDDQRVEEAAQMHDVEDRILTSIGMGPVYGTEPQ